MPFPKSPPAPPAPTGATTGGAPGVGIAVTFPDGSMVVLSSQTTVFPDSLAGSPAIVVGPTGSAVLTYIVTDFAEMASIMNEINEAVASGATQLVLASTAAIPAAADITVTPNGGTINGGTTVALSVTAPGVGAKPTKGAFHQGGIVRFGGIPALQTVVVNSWLVVCVSPPGLTAAAVAVSFYDDHGGVDKPAAFTYS